MPRLWRYKRDGQECGPVTGDDLKMLTKSQRLGPTDLVCKDGTNHWFPARGIRGLFPRPGLFGKFVGWFGTRNFVIALLALLLVGVGVGFLLYALRPPPTPAPTPPPPEIHHHTHLLKALHEMKKARDELHGLHHEHEIMESLDNAIGHAEQALKTAGVKVEEAEDDLDAYRKYSAHRHLQDAHDELIKAQTEISDSKDDLGKDKDGTLAELKQAADKLQDAMEDAKR